MIELGVLAKMQGADAEYARRILIGGHGSLESYTLQSRTRATRDAYALAVSRGALTYQPLLARILFEAAHSRLEHSLATKEFDSRAFLSLTRTIASQADSENETYHAVQMFKTALSLWGSKSLSRTDRLIFLEAVAALGYVRDLEKYADRLKVSTFDRNQLNLLTANALIANNLSRHATSPSERWLELVNAGYRDSNIETISFAPGDDALFDRILCGPAEYVESGPKVTVIVPTFNSGSRISTALRSLTNQTWRNLEILVMDDDSPAQNDVFLAEWQERDPRIRVHKMAENGGTYRARNYAVAHLATGEYVTVHDDDDWSHPRKIETQVTDLINDPGRVANMSKLSRATPDLMFTRINNNAIFTQPNYSSLMFRREPVVERIGFWDDVNRSADAEFHDRLKVAFPGGYGVVGEDVLSFLRVRAGSLTSGEISRGYIDRRRLWYQQASRDWHTRAGESGASLRIEATPGGEREFSAPVDMMGSRGAKKAVEVDVLYVTDFRFPGGNSSVTSVEIEQLLLRGMRVALMQMASPVNSARSIIHQRILSLSRDPLIKIVSPLDTVHARLTLVRHPSVLQYADAIRSGVDTEELVVIVNHAPFTKDGLGSIFDFPQISMNARAVFGRQVRFAAESNLIRKEMMGVVPPGTVLPTAWPGIVKTPRAAMRPAPSRIIGRHGRDHTSKWPETAEMILASYPNSESYEVRVLGGAECARRVMDGIPENWIVHPYGSIEPAEFLRDLPFWVYQHHSSLTESFGMAAAEAMAAGCVVLLPPYMESTFGDGAVYAENSEVLDVIERFIEDPDSYYRQSARAKEYVRINFSDEAFHARIAALLESPESGEKSTLG